MTIEKVEYSDLKENDKVLIQDTRRNCGVLFFVAKSGKFICWEDQEGREIWDDITALKDKGTKLIGRICSEQK